MSITSIRQLVDRLEHGRRVLERPSPDNAPLIADFATIIGRQPEGGALRNRSFWFGDTVLGPPSADREAETYSAALEAIEHAGVGAPLICWRCRPVWQTERDGEADTVRHSFMMSGVFAWEESLNPSGIVPTDVKVLFFPDPVEEKTAGGIIRPDMLKEREQYATVKGTILAVGPNAFIEWGAGNGPVAGSRVVTAQYAGLNIDGADGRKYRLCNDEDIIGILKEDQ